MRPADALRRHMEMGSTGSLTVERPGDSDIAIYLMQGEILAAEATDDGPQLVRRLVNGGHVSADLGQSLLARLANAAQVGDVLFGTVPDDVVMDLYGRRFRQNLVDFLLAEGDSEFASCEDIHVENVQVGHDSYELLEQLDAALARVGRLLPPATPLLLVGDEPPLSNFQIMLLESLPVDGSLDAMLDASPREPVETMLEVLALLDQGSLLLDGEENVELLQAPDEEITADHEEPDGDIELMAEPMVVDDDELMAEPTVVDDISLLDQPPLDERDIAVFADNDFSRGRSGDGIFSVSRELLDTVDLSGLALLGPGESDDELLLEMEDGDEIEAAGGAVSLRFGSPPLTHEEAITKIEVTNEVLRQLAQALDDEHGSGSGQASVQLLLESSGSAFASLFAGVDASRDGALDTMRVLGNIDKRPESERRRSLNRAMRDLVERGFTLAVERVSEGRFELLLERIAGYQHRLGL